MNRSLGAAAALLTQGTLMRRQIALVTASGITLLGLVAAACTSKGASSSTSSGHSPSAATAPRPAPRPVPRSWGDWNRY
jgi:hypothetical protein